MLNLFQPVYPPPTVTLQQPYSMLSGEDGGSFTGSRVPIALAMTAGATESDVDSSVHHEETTATILPTTLPPSSSKQRPSYLNKLVLSMKSSLEELNARDVTPDRLESMAILIQESMSRVSRNYHSVSHIFDISVNETDPIALLGTYFHDTIYYSIDGNLTPKQTEILEGTFVLDPETEKHTFYASSSKNDIENDVPRKIAETVFGYEAGQEITVANGLNEFLSAIVAVRELQHHVTNEELAQIACVIESTIPFRQPNAETGRTALEQLHVNMQTTRAKFQLSLSDDDLVKSVQRAAIMSNNDVGNFGSSDRQWFLDNTWSLLDEGNESLRQTFLYTVQEFQQALFKLYGFFNFLLPSMVFGSFQGVPNKSELEAKQSECSTNLRIGRSYVGAKLLDISLVAAFAELTGGDAPRSMFLGDLPNHPSETASVSLREYLPALPDPAACAADCDEVVLEILDHGRHTETNFDVKDSPLAAYLYCHLGDAGVHQLLDETTVYPMDPPTAQGLLLKLPQPIVQVVGNSLSQLATTRSERIQILVQELESMRMEDATS